MRKLVNATRSLRTCQLNTPVHTHGSCMRPIDSHVHINELGKQQSVDILCLPEDKLPTLYNTLFYKPNIQPQWFKKATSHDFEAPLYHRRLHYYAPNWNWLLLYSGHTNPSWPWHGHFQELGSILSPDEELCMDHLRSGSGQAKLWLQGGWSTCAAGESAPCRS